MIASWLAAPLVAGFVVVALYCATSLAVRGRPFDRLAAAEANHVVMAVAMTVMLLPGGMAWVPLPVGIAVFAVAASAWLVLRSAAPPVPGPPVCGTHPAHLVVLNVAMIVMYAVMGTPAAADPGMGSMPGMAAPAAPAPAVTLGCALLALYLVAHAGRSVVVGVRSPAPAGVGGLGVLHRAAVSPGVRSACQAFMSAGMGLMLVVVL